ncbi:MAG: enhanced serine sensitivity protein SseB C-terminal domain-containing protein [Bdellovibrionaceae bacterium]|nr:enhanced serine sensitivity protein SseB C-terminal domain-containing protein [Bdellovibrionales bacterium]MCB9254044.1 enhanced serine sensitivity protein SseB C-terminal domain-containing protein [Pseudobdellovibrionaceae bacterium]
MDEKLNPREKELEALLEEAGGSPAARPEFYRKLLESELYVLGEGAHNGLHVVGEPHSVSVASFGFEDGLKTPVFSSLEKLQLFLTRMGLTEAQHFIRMSARTLFESINKNPLMLNPGSDVAKELTLAEIESLLDGSIFSKVEKVTVPEQTSVFYGQPAEYPEPLVAQLVKYFEKQETVNAAYLALMIVPNMENPMSYVIGIDHHGNFDTIANDISLIAGEVLEKGKSLTFEDLSDPTERNAGEGYLKTTEPFYRREKKGLLGALATWFGKK